MQKCRMPLWLPLVFLFAIGVFAFVIPSWTTAIANLGKLSGLSEAWAGFAGAIIAAFMTIVSTVATAIAAWFAIQSQNRITILTREEERIESEYPGLIEARQLLGLLVLHLPRNTKAKSALRTIEWLGFQDSSFNFLGEVERKLPNSQDALRRRLANILSAICACAVPVRSGEELLREAMESNRSPGNLNEGVEEMGNMLSTYIGFLHSMNLEVFDRVKRLDARRKVCRTEIERFFHG